MALRCPNKNLPEFQKLVSELGEVSAYKVFISNGYDVPDMNTVDGIIDKIKRKPGEVDYQLKVISNIFTNLDKVNNWIKKIGLTDKFWDKIQHDLQIPKEQVELLKNSEGNTIEDKLLDFTVKYSYTAEINISKSKEISKFKQTPEGFVPEYGGFFIDEDGVPYHIEGEVPSIKYYRVNEKISKEEFDKAYKEKIEEHPTQYYSGLTVPGGTNYTENEISTPLITPSIKGHAQFSTEKGLGWFRSDEQVKGGIEKAVDWWKTAEHFLNSYDKIVDVEIADERTDAAKIFNRYKTLNELTKEVKEITEDKSGIATLLHIIDKDNNNRYFRFPEQQDITEITKEDYNIEKHVKTIGGIPTKTRRILEIQSDLFQKGRYKKQLVDTPLEGIEELTPEKYGFYKERDEKNADNQFLQLLNKDNNWVTFFVKSIIQDSAKKGYEKVLFPSGNTASKVEGHATLEEFKRQKEDRLKKILKDKEDIIKVNYTTSFGMSKEEFENNKKQDLEKIDVEVKQIKIELKRVEEEGFAALKPIFKFYEEIVGNILKKQGYNPKKVTDEYGNTWNEVTVDPSYKSSIYFKLRDKTVAPTPVPIADRNIEAEKYLKSFLHDIGAKIEVVDNLKVKGLDVNAIADITNRVILLSKDKYTTKDLAEETGHFIIALLGDNHPLVKAMKGIVNQTDNYADTVNDYKEIYENNEDKLRKEHAGKIFSDYLIHDIEPIVSKDNKSFGVRLKNLMNLIIRRIKQIFSKADENTLKSNLDRIFGKAAKIVTERNISDLTQDLSKEGQYYSYKAKRPSERKETVYIPPLHEQTERIGRIIDRLKYRRVSKGDVFAATKLDVRIKELEKKKKLIEDNQDIAILIDTAKDDLLHIGNAIANYYPSERGTGLEHDEKIDLFNIGVESLSFWQDLNKKIDTKDKETDDTINKISAEAGKMYGKLFNIKNGMVLDFINETVGGREMTNSEMFTELSGVSMIEAQLLDPGVSPIPIVSKSIQYQQELKGKLMTNVRDFTDLLTDKSNKLIEYASQTGTTYNRIIIDLMIEKDDNGNWRGNYTNEIDAEWYKIRDKLKNDAKSAVKGSNESRNLWKKYNNWMRENTEETADIAAYQKALALETERLKNPDGTMSEDAQTELDMFENMENPETNSESSYTKQIPLKSKWTSKQYNIIKTKYKGTPIEEYYDFMIESFHIFKLMVPYDKRLPSNYMPEFIKSLVSTLVQNGVSSFFRTGTNRFWESIVNSVKYEPETSREHRLEDENKKLIRSIPVYMMSNKLDPSEKISDPSEVLKHFANVAYTYYYKKLAEEPIILVKQMLSNAEFGKEGTIIGPSAPVVQQIEYYMDSVLYDRRNSKLPLGKQKFKIDEKTLEESEKFRVDVNKLIRIPITYAVLKFMSANPFSATVNLLWGILSTMKHSNTGLDYSKTSGMMGLTWAIKYTFDRPLHLGKKLINSIIGKKTYNYEYSKMDGFAKRFGLEKIDVDSGSYDTAVSGVKDTLLILQKVTEKFIRVHTMMAVLLDEKVLDMNGKERGLYDAFIIKNNKMQWDFKNFSKEEYEKFADNENKLRLKIRRVSANLHGAYDPELTRLGSKHALGAAAQLFRVWMFSTFYTRFGGRRFDRDLGRETEGYYRSFIGNPKATLSNIASLVGIKISADELDKRNAREAYADIVLYGLLVFVGMMVKGIDIDDDDDEEVAMYKYIMQTLTTSKQDFTFFLSPGSFTKVIQNVLPPVNAMADFVEMLGLGVRYISGEDLEIKRGPYTGQDKFKRAFINAIPGGYEARKVLELPKRKIEGFKLKKKKVKFSLSD